MRCERTDDSHISQEAWISSLLQVAFCALPRCHLNGNGEDLGNAKGNNGVEISSKGFGKEHPCLLRKMKIGIASRT